MLLRLAHVPLKPVRSFPAAAAPITLGPDVATGPAEDVPPAPPKAAIVTVANATATPVLRRHVTTEGYGAGRRRSLLRCHERRGAGRKPALPPRVGTAPRPTPRLDGRLVHDAERPERESGAVLVRTDPKHV
jgi:hypothetical protein